MESALALIGVFVGVLIGIFAYDFRQRHKVLEALNDAQEKFIKSQTVLSDLHNSSTQHIKALTDKVSALEMRAASMGQPNVTKKF